jgi:hypothetical protein
VELRVLEPLHEMALNCGSAGFQYADAKVRENTWEYAKGVDGVNTRSVLARSSRVAVKQMFYDTTDVASEFANAGLDTRTTDEVMVSTSIRLRQSVIDKVRAKAADLGIPATTLMRQWVIERR